MNWPARPVVAIPPKRRSSRSLRGSARGGETDLQGGHDEDDSDENEQERRHRAEHVAVDTEAEPNGRHEQAERHEGQGEPGRQGRRPQTMLGGRSPQNDGK